MPDPTYQPPEPDGFRGSVLRRLAALRAFEEAGAVRNQMADIFSAESAERGLSPDFYGVLAALRELTAEVRQLRAAIEPSSSPIVHGAEAVRAFRDLQEKR